MKILPGKANAPKAVGASGAGDTTSKVGTLRAILTLNAVLAHDERLTVLALRAIRATNTTNAVVAANKPLRLFAEGASGATLALDALHTARVCGVPPKLALQIPKSCLEVSKS